MRKFLIILFIFGIAGCSNKAIYNKLRLDKRDKCAKEPPSTYFECIERTNKSYEEYERERNEKLGTQKRINAVITVEHNNET